MREIGHLLTQIDVHIAHVYREANQAADFLANWSCRLQREFLFRHVKDIPVGLKGILRVECMGLPNLRCKKF